MSELKLLPANALSVSYLTSTPSVWNGVGHPGFGLISGDDLQARPFDATAGGQPPAHGVLFDCFERAD